MNKTTEYIPMVQAVKFYKESGILDKISKLVSASCERQIQKDLEKIGVYFRKLPVTLTKCQACGQIQREVAMLQIPAAGIEYTAICGLCATKVIGGYKMLGIPKQKTVRLKGKKLVEFNAYIHSRDGHKCVICPNPVAAGEKFHHERSGVKSDIEEEAALLCQECHHERHFGEDSDRIRTAVRDYLTNLYGVNRWQKGE